MNLKDIRLNPDNPRFIKDDKFKKLCQSIKEFPKMLELRPIIVDSTGLILGGNMRFRAITQLGLELKDEWFKEASSLTDEEKRRFIVEDNVGFGEWDWDKLSVEFEKEELEDWGLDIDKWKEDEVIEDEVPEVSDEPPVSKLGEVYKLGRHRIMCGDSTKIEDVEKLMDGKTADMVFTDPPYGMDLDTDYSGMKGWHQGKKYEKVIGDKFQFNFKDFKWLECKEQFWWGGDYYVDTLPNFGKDGSWFVWDKRVDESKDKMFGSGFEMLWSKNKHQRRLLRAMWAGFMGDAEASKRVHPTQKPTKLCADILKEYGKDNWNVLDLFLGSGSTLIACEQTNRICYGMEIDPKYCDVIRKRYAKFIGKEEEWEKITPSLK